MTTFNSLLCAHRNEATLTRFGVGTLLLWFAAGCTSPTVIDTPEATPRTVETPIPTVSYRIKRDPITIAAVGDIMLGTDFPDNRLPDDDGLSFLDGVVDILSEADVVFGNLEGVLMDGGEPFKVCNNPSLCYLFRTPTRYAQILKDAGFDVLSLANNHARDFGEDGRTATMDVLDQVGILHSGREGDIASWEHNGIRLAMIAFAPHPESHSLLEIEQAAALVTDIAERHDVVIVSFHGGAEGVDALHLTFGEEFFYEQPRGDLVRFSRAVIDAGADLVFGHGPHVVRAIEVYKQRVIAYSLGNFATYYGISVAGIKGQAPILSVTVDQDGQFLSGNIDSTIQIRPNGPTVDSKHRAYLLMRDLSHTDLGEKAPLFDDDNHQIRPRIKQ